MTKEELEKENAELKKNYDDSLVAYGVLKNKVNLLAQPSLIESMQDALITTQKVANEKQKEQLAKAKEIIRRFVDRCKMCVAYPEAYITWYREIDEAEQFLGEVSE